MRTFRITPVVCDHDLDPRPVLLTVSRRCRECGSVYAPVGPPEWHAVTTEVPVDRGSSAQLVLKVSGNRTG